jgi:hypothetical protein
VLQNLSSNFSINKHVGKPMKMEEPRQQGMQPMHCVEQKIGGTVNEMKIKMTIGMNIKENMMVMKIP